MEIVSGYGASVVPSRLVSDEDAAVAAALELGFPAVLKVVSADISHKSDFGGVQLNLRGEDGVRAAWREMMEAVADRAPAARVDGALVQPMLRGGRDLIVGSRLDRNFGHVVLVGMGGVFVEILRDTAMRVAPFGADTARGMVRQLRAFPILAGVRGEPPADVDALVDTILAVCRLVSDVPEITELDLNPVRVLDSGKGCLVLDARMAVAAEDGSPDER
jgi:acyl-CoA synthetase (NDP forming)